MRSQAGSWAAPAGGERAAHLPATAALLLQLLQLGAQLLQRHAALGQLLPRGGQLACRARQLLLQQHRACGAALLRHQALLLQDLLACGGQLGGQLSARGAGTHVDGACHQQPWLKQPWRIGSTALQAAGSGQPLTQPLHARQLLLGGLLPQRQVLLLQPQPRLCAGQLLLLPPQRAGLLRLALPGVSHLVTGCGM